MTYRIILWDEKRKKHRCNRVGGDLPGRHVYLDLQTHATLKKTREADPESLVGHYVAVESVDEGTAKGARVMPGPQDK